MAKIIAVVENTTLSNKYRCKHGICLYIETNKHRILFDTGSNRLFLENAKKLGINIKEIDLVVISHGHTDHAGALELFLKENNTAKVYIKESAFDNHFINVIGIPINVGIDKKIKDSSQIVFTNEKQIIDDELSLFSEVKEREYYSKSNNALYVKKKGKIVQDSFSHEQYLVIKDNNKKILISGCSHNGIVNIIKKGMSEGEVYDYVIGGFHLYNPVSKKYEKEELIRGVAKQLKKNNTQYYTCHCTGVKAFNKMKFILGDKLHYMATGSVLEIK